MASMVTLKDVAAEAGVSPATVSYALRGGQYVSEHTAKLVHDAANKLGYTTNVAARSLRYGKTGVIEVVVRGLDLSSLYARMVTHVKKACATRGYHALFMQTEMESQSVRDAVSELNNQSCDGILLDTGSLTEKAIRDLSQKRAIVLLDDQSAHPAFDVVRMPRREMARVATEHLIGLGCRRIMLLGAPIAGHRRSARYSRGSDVLQYKGFMDAMEAAGLDVGEDQLVPSYWRYFVGVDRGRAMARDGFDFDGVVCCNDALALGLIRGLADGGVQVPRDLKVIGIDGISIGEFTVPRLSTVSVDMTDLAEKGIGMLTDRIDGRYDGSPRLMETKYKLIARESTGVLPAPARAK